MNKLVLLSLMLSAAFAATACYRYQTMSVGPFFVESDGTLASYQPKKRGERSFFAISGYKNQKDDTKFGGPIPQGKYAIIEDPWNKRDNWFGLFYKDDERFDDYIQGGSSDDRGEFRFHRFINLSLGCISVKTKTEEDYLKIYEWIKGTETQKVKDADGIWHIDYGEIEVISDDD